MIRVSTIITTYNSAKSIEKTIRSVLGQDGAGKLFDLELIVVDDGSVDETPDIVKKLGVTLYSTDRNSGGPNKGRNIGLKQVTGDYICFLDHDDSWEPDKILWQLKAARYAPIVTCGYSVVNTQTGLCTVRGINDARIRVFKNNVTFLKKLAREKINLQHTYLSTIMIHKSLKDILFEENFGMLDYDWLLRLFENQRSVEISAALVTRFVSDDNLSLNNEYRKKDYYYSLMFLETLQRKYPKEVAAAHRRINGSRARYCYLAGDMHEARRYLLKAMPGAKELLYYLTSFYGSHWVKKRFTVFG